MTSASQKPTLESRGTVVSQIGYHGWPGSYLISNEIAEVVVVPAIGRIMQFRMIGDEDGVFWENRALDGHQPAPTASDWTNFGGDKTWPAPQDAWTTIAGRPWPPPAAFDSMPVEAKVQGSGLVLTSPMDASYGIQTVREIALDSARPKLTVKTVYHKVLGKPVKAGVWIITQLRDPQRVFALLPEQVKRKPGYYQMQGDAPLDLKHDGRLVSFRRDSSRNSKIGAEGNALLWIGEKYLLRIEHDSPKGSNSVYTSMDPLQYVELETEGPVTNMSPGDKIELTNSYELTRRTTDDLTSQALRAFGLTTV